MARTPKQNPKTSPKGIDVAERRRKLLELRKAGLSYQEIVDHHPELGYKTPAAAAQDGTRALRAMLQEPADDVRALELSRLDGMTRAIWADAMRGNVAKVDRVVKLMERRAKLLGLDYAERGDGDGAREDAKGLIGDLADAIRADAGKAATPAADSGGDEQD